MPWASDFMNRGGAAIGLPGPGRRTAPAGARTALCSAGRLVAVAALLALASAALRAAEFDCVLEPRQMVELRSPATGLIERILVERGQFVRAGQVVVELDSGAERAALEVARHKAMMQGAVRSGQSRLGYATLKLSRRESLAADDLISQQDRDETATERRLAESELQEASDNVRLAELEVRRNEELIRLRSLRSPVSGVVMERNMHVGELADTADSRKPILKIADISTLHAEAVLPAAAYPHVKVSSRATVRVTLPQAISATATVRVVDRVLDAASGTFGVRLELPNPNLAIPAGIQCRVEFPDVPAEVAGRPRRTAVKPAP
jgi:RND family efflux transporter MFP subunit